MARPHLPLLAVTCAMLAGAAAGETVEEGISRPGATYQTLPLDPADSTPERTCAELCAAEDACRAWTLVRPGHPEKGADQFGLCLLKDAVPERVEDGCCVSGVKAGVEAEAEEEAATPEPEAAPDPGAPGWIGLQIQNVTPEIATSLGLGQSEGALVVSAAPDGPADRAGLRDGDLIVAVGGAPVADIRALVREVAARSPGETVAVTILREGEERILDVEIGARPN